MKGGKEGEPAGKKQKKGKVGAVWVAEHCCERSACRQETEEGQGRCDVGCRNALLWSLSFMPEHPECMGHFKLLCFGDALGRKEGLQPTFCAHLGSTIVLCGEDMTESLEWTYSPFTWRDTQSLL